MFNKSATGTIKNHLWATGMNKGFIPSSPSELSRSNRYIISNYNSRPEIKIKESLAMTIQAFRDSYRDFPGGISGKQPAGSSSMTES